MLLQQLRLKPGMLLVPSFPRVSVALASPPSSFPCFLLLRFSSSPHVLKAAQDTHTHHFSSTHSSKTVSSICRYAAIDDSLNRNIPGLCYDDSLKPGLYLVATPIGNLEDITLRALRVLKSADLILSEDTRHSGKLLQHYNINTPLLSYHKFNESHRETTVLKRLQQGGIIALISDAGTPGISDPGMELAKLCVNVKIPVIPIPGPSALLAALSASGLSTDNFRFVGFLAKGAARRKEQIVTSADDAATQIFFVPPHKLHQFLEETIPVFGESRQCVIAREITKLHEEFWRGTLNEAKEALSNHQPKGEITLLIEGKEKSISELPSEMQLENDLRLLVSNGHSLSMAVKLVSEGTSVKRKAVYELALRVFGKKFDAEDSSSGIN